MPNMLFANNCNTTLASSLTNVATILSVTSATGFPAPTGSQYFYCTLADAATQLVIEIVKVTNVTGTTFTIVRGQDGTTGTAFNAGDVVSLRLVRASLNDFPKLDETNTYTGSQVLAASTSSLVPLNIPVGTTPTSAATGSIWSETEGLYYHNSTYITELDIGDNTAGVLTQPTITVTGSGATINASSVEAVLYSQVGWVGDLKKYIVPAATGLSLTDQSANYLIVSYNSGSPVYSITTNVATIDNSSVVGAALLWRNGTQVHYQPIDWGRSCASRLNRRLVQTNRYQWASGLALGESTGNVITLTAGVIWYGVTQYSEASVTSASSNADFYYHVSGVWTTTTASTYNNTQYDDGTNLQTLGPGKYAVNWVYRYLDGSGLPKLAYILGSGNYSQAQAIASAPPSPPPILSTMAILVGRIIVVKNGATATEIDSAFTQVFSSSSVLNHNDLSGLQGGNGTTEEYHLTSAEYTGTGTGNFVRTTSPTLVTPLLGTPTSGTLTNCTGLPLSTGVTGTLSASLGGTGEAGTLTGILYGNGASAQTVATTAQALSLIGTLPIANGGTGLTSFTAGQIHYGSFSTSSNLYFDGTNLLVGSNTSAYGTLNVQRNTSTPYASLTITDNATPANPVGIYLRATGTACGISTAGAPIALSVSPNLGNIGLQVNASGGVSIGNTTDPGATNLSVTGSIVSGSTVKTAGYTVATLPTGVTGARTYVTNALAPVFGATVVGGGAVIIPVFYNGTNWIVG